jgi:hypothetical protein
MQSRGCRGGRVLPEVQGGRRGHRVLAKGSLALKDCKSFPRALADMIPSRKVISLMTPDNAYYQAPLQNAAVKITYITTLSCVRGSRVPQEVQGGRRGHPRARASPLTSPEPLLNLCASISGKMGPCQNGGPRGTEGP